MTARRRTVNYDGRGTPSEALVYHAFGSTSNPSWSFTATLGTAVDANDFIIAFVAAAAATLTGVTLGGHAMTSLISIGSGTFQAYYLDPATVAGLGSTASLVVGGTGTGNGSAVALFRVSKADPTAIDMQGATTTASLAAVGVNLAVSAENQIVLGGCCGFSAGGTAIAFTLSGISTDYSEQVLAQTLEQAGGHFLTTAGGALPVSATPNHTLSARIIGLVFQGL